jgi:hypothetical protein
MVLNNTVKHSTWGDQDTLEYGDNGEPTFWTNFQQEPAVEEIDPTPPEKVIKDITDKFGIELAQDISTFFPEYISVQEGTPPEDVRYYPGSLDNVDLKRANPIAAMKASMIEAYAMSDASGRLIEMTVNAEGLLELYYVGESAGSLTDKDVYYTITSANYLVPEAHAMVTGAKPRQQRIIYPWHRLIGPGAHEPYQIWNNKLLRSDCLDKGYSEYAVVTYKDFLGESGSP